MKIYFAASIRGGREMAKVYPVIVGILEKLGHEVLSSMFADQNIDENEGTNPTEGSNFIYQRDTAWLNEADVVVAEVTQPSLGVGYEIAKAEEMKKRVICLYHKQTGKKLSAIIDGSPNLNIIYYQDVDELEVKLSKTL